MTTQTLLKKTPLYDEHVRLGAKMVPFGGWSMPVQYEGILAEYRHTRQACALFDTSHMGEFTIQGSPRESGLDRLVTMPIADLPEKTSRYGLLLNEQGGTLDDLIVFRAAQDQWFIVVNGATTDKDASQMQNHLTAQAHFQDISLKTGKLDLQGPLSREILKKFVAKIENLDYFTFDYFQLLGEHVLISRTGYTGELGYEIFFPWEKTPELWNTLLADSRVKPAGLGARDVLRLEMGYSLYGHELSEDISPLEAGLNRFVDWQKDFIGKDALLKQKELGLTRKLAGICSADRRSPRQQHPVYCEDGQEIGVVSSGTFSPHLNRGIGLGFLLSDHAAQGNKIFLGRGKNQIAAEVVPRIFYKNGSLKN